MTFNMFIAFLTIGSLVSSLLTEAVKKSFQNIATNMIALINAVVVGLVGTVIEYILFGIELNLKNVICIVLMMFCMWMGSMVGYDKVMQTILQIKGD